MSLQWPESVLVLDPECGHELTEKPGANARNQPHSPLGWVNNEFRLSEAPPSQVDLMIRIWAYRYDCLRFYRAKYPHTYTDYDVYNAAWVSCGYLENQPASAIKLCKERFMVEPNGDVLDDPNITVPKKVEPEQRARKTATKVAKKTAKKKVLRKKKAKR